MSDDEMQRLRRELRAMGAVNRQLQAQLDEPATGAKVRRSGTADSWIEQLSTAGVVQATLCTSPDGRVFVIEGDQKRAVPSGILAAALEEELGAADTMSSDQLAALSDGAPVELLEATEGPAFVVVGGIRRSVRGVPLPHPVSNRQASEIPAGAELNVAAANVPRHRYREAATPGFQVERALDAVRRDGVVATTKAIAAKVRRRLRG